jgi:hypothetical protein
MTPRAALPPAWLGLFAIASFGGLVLASFASGYHLVVTPIPGEPPAASVPGSVPAGASVPSSVPGSASASTAAAAPAPREAVARRGLTPDLAVVRSEPEKGEILARLPANQSVSVLSREGLWARIEFSRNGKSVAGWTLASNLSLR